MVLRKAQGQLYILRNFTLPT